jgi:PAS domain S-box-containing protein
MAAYKMNEQIARELAEMRQQQERLEICGRELLRAQKTYDRLIESAPDAMVYVNREGEIAFINAQMEKLFGYQEEELVGKDLEILIPERFRAGHRENVLAYFSCPRVRPMGTGLEFFCLRKDGTEFPADISLSYLETDGESLAVGAIRDITERRRAERKIQQNYFIQKVISAVLRISLEPIAFEEQLDRIIDLILTIPGLALQSEGCIYLVEDDQETLVLKVLRRFSGSQPAPCEKVPFGKCLCGLAASSRTAIFADCLDERHEIRHAGEVPHGHYCVPIVCGEKTLGLINIFVKEGHKRTPEEEEFLTAIAITLHGIIERHRADMEKHRLIEQLAESEKLSALGRITANVAHEIRNPLTTIGGFTRRLQKRFANGTKEKEYTGLIFTEVIRLEGILRNVLSFSRRAGPHAEECNIIETIEKALTIYGEICAEQRIIINKAFGDVPLTAIDKEQVLQAIENLVSNAIDAMPGGGVLSVTADREEVKDIAYVVVKIRDTGGGIPEEDLSKIFEPFYTTKLALKGAGLGLSITKKIVEDHGGAVQVDSKIGAGSTFSLYFPLKTRL